MVQMSGSWHKDIIKVALSLTTNTVKRHQGDCEQNALSTGVPAPVANVTCFVYCNNQSCDVALCSITSKYEITAVNCLISTYKQTWQTLFQRDRDCVDDRRTELRDVSRDAAAESVPSISHYDDVITLCVWRHWTHFCVTDTENASWDDRSHRSSS